MAQKELVIKTLNDMNINFKEVKHQAVWTTEEADKVIQGMEGVPSKTLFLAGKKNRRFYLIIMDDKKRLDFKKISEITDDRMHFASKEQLKNKLGLVPGMVSLFGLINNQDHDIEIYIDKALLEEKYITFHPNDNTATFFITMEHAFKFIVHLNYQYQFQ